MRANSRLMLAIRKVVSYLEEGGMYWWSDIRYCNCGLLAKFLVEGTGLVIDRLHLNEIVDAVQSVNWSDMGKYALEVDISPTTELPNHTIFRELYEAGLDKGEDYYLIEYLSKTKLDDYDSYADRIQAIRFFKQLTDQLERELEDESKSIVSEFV